MKQYKHIFFTSLMGFFLIFSFPINAEVSKYTQTYLDKKDFNSAKNSIEKDILSDEFDAKAWYFYSRILFQLDQPNAAKQALNNALNIDKNGSFAKGGIPTIKNFASDITQKINNINNERPFSFRKISGSDYDNYLTSIFGNGHPYNNYNPAKSSDISLALRNKNSSFENKKESLPSTIISENLTKKDILKKEESNSWSAFWLLGLLLIPIIAGIIIYVKNKKQEMAKIIKEKDKKIELFNILNALVFSIEEKSKDYEMLIPKTEVSIRMSNLYSTALMAIKDVNLDDISTTSINRLKEIIADINLEKDTLENAYKNEDFDLKEYFKEKEEKRIIAERLRKEREERERIIAENERRIKNERDERNRIERAERKKIEDEIEKERVRTGYYEKQRLEKLANEEERRVKRERENNRHQHSNGLNDTLIGITALSAANEILRSKNKEDDNSNIWSSKKTSSSDDNNDIWKSSSDDNNDIWNSNSSGSSDNSKDW